MSDPTTVDRSTVNPTPRRGCKLPAPVFALLMSGCAAAGATTPIDAGAPATAERLFERHELSTGIAAPQTVLPGFFLDRETAEIAVLHLDERGARRLRMYGLVEDGWASVLEATLRPGVLFVDVARIGGRDRLITYDNSRLSWFDPESATERALVEASIGFNPEHDGQGSPTEPGAELPRVDVTRDLNQDGLDDVVLPAVDGFWVATQRSDGSFGEAVKLGPGEPFADELMGKIDPKARTYGEMGITAGNLPIYLGRVHQMDYDRDGRGDLVFWNEDRFEVHLQEPGGTFRAAPVAFTPEVPFDADGVYAFAFEFVDRGVWSQLLGVGEKVRRKVLHSILDLDGDGVADLVTLTLSGRSMMRLRSVYEVHYGRAMESSTAFSRRADATLHPSGRAGGMQPWGYSSQWLKDFDGDGRLDMMFRDVNVGFGGMFRALVGNSVPINLELYRFTGDGYGERPTARRRIRDFAPFAGIGNVFLPPVLMGDVDGDGRSDLLVGESPRELRIFFGVAGPDLLARRPEKVMVALPQDERRTRLVDLNRDGKRDLLVHLTPTGHDPDRPHKLTMLIAR